MNNLQPLKKIAPSIRAIFIDDGGVLNDNRLRSIEYPRLIGEFMSACLGGTAQQWADANSQTFPPLWAKLQRQIMDFPNHQAYQREYEHLWIGGMCSLMSVPMPHDDIVFRIAREAAIFTGKHAQTEIEGATDLVWKLFGSGYTLYTASGSPSWELKEIFTRMGINNAFGGLYGPDIVEKVKYGAKFYKQIFAHSDVTPSECVVIESSHKCCNWAIEAGAQAIWVDCTDADAATLYEVRDAFL